MPVDIASLVYFRICFGAIMLWEVVRYFQHGWIEKYWIKPQLHFTYYGFDWVQPWPGNGMYLHFVVLGVLAVLIMVGLCYRASTVLFFLGFTYMFLLEQARYLNHFYLICLISFLMIFIPAHRSFSLDAKLRPSIKTNTLPAWMLWLLLAQISIVYFYGGLAKLNADWLRGEPMRMWMASRSDYRIIGPLLKEEATVYFLSYGGLIYDLLIVPMLLWRRTRVVAFVASVFFHVTNALVFSIGIFPWFMIAATALYFRPDWPRQFFQLARDTIQSRRQTTQEPAQEQCTEPATPEHWPKPPLRLVIVTCISVYLLLQLLVPLRHFIYPGIVHWTEEGHRFSWHMKLRSKKSRARFRIRLADSQETLPIDPGDYMPRWQERAMGGRPDMILQFCHFLAEQKQDDGFKRVRVYADVKVSLNGRRFQPFIDPDIDLATQERTLKSRPWVQPLGQ